MSPLSLPNYLVVGAALFVLGMIGFLTRRNLIIMFLCAEMMLQGVAINLVAFSRHWGNLQGQARRSLDVSLWQDLREPGQEPTTDENEDPLPPPPPSPPMPVLTPAGPEPHHREETSHV
jgi:NADH-quinone oxidoreductase subunit K